MERSPLSRGADLWDALAAEKRDIWLYGMGNGADKLLAVLSARGIPVRGVFASDGFVRGQTFHGERVRAYREIEAAYPAGGCVILLAFGTSRPEVMALIDRAAARYPLFVPDLPVCGDTLFDRAFYEAHRDELSLARSLFSNENSRALFDAAIDCKLSGEHARFAAAVSEKSALELLAPLPVFRMVDLGAYDGDSAREALSVWSGLRFILATEPDGRSYRKLTAWRDTVRDVEIECHRAAAWDKRGEMPFTASGNRSAGLFGEKSGAAVPTDTVDDLLGGRPADYIKYDVEGAEAAALRGSAETIKRFRPALRVALYHRGEDLFALPLLLRELAPEHDFFLTRPAGYPLWDLDLVALPRTN